MSMPLNNDEAEKEMAVPLLETVMELLAGYGLNREACAHWQRVLRAILHGFISQEDLAEFSDTHTPKMRNHKQEEVGSMRPEFTLHKA